MTRPNEQIAGLVTGGAALALRIATGVFTLGWSPQLLFGDEAAAVGPGTDKYAFRFGPFAFRDTSPLLADAPRPETPLILYEYEASPFCRKVREAALLLDIPLELRPCPGARAGFASELKERTGRMTVPVSTPRRQQFRGGPSPRSAPRARVRRLRTATSYYRPPTALSQYLVDPNAAVEMFESEDIIEYLLDTYLLDTYGPPRDAYDPKVRRRSPAA